MVQRNYQAPQFQVQDRRVLQEQQVAAADTRPNYAREVGDNQWRDRLFTQIGQNAGAALNKMADIEFSNLYMEGQAAVGVVQSEAELQGNPLTRDWKVAGYRDTMGKLALADNEANFQEDLASLREQNPADLQAYLAKRRQAMLPAMAGMSREARAQMAGQMLLADRAATTRWTSEHTKFIIDQKSQAVHTQWNVAMRGMSDSQLQVQTGQLKPQDFTELLRSTAGTIVGSVWMDNSLPSDVKKQLTFEMAQTALANDSVALYDYLRETPIPDQTLEGKEDKPSTLISRLEAAQQLKLANSYREAYQRTNDSRSLFRMGQLAQVESQIDNDRYTGSYGDLTGMLDPMVLNKTISGERRASLLNKYLDKQYKGEQNSTLANALMSGDVQTIYGQGKGIDDGVKALEKVLARRGMPTDQQMQIWIQVGRNGVEQGYKKVGEYLGVTLRQMVDSKDGTVLPQHVAMFKSINESIRDAESQGLVNTRVNVLSGLNGQDRMFAEQVFHRVDAGASADEAINEAKKAIASDTGLSPSIRSARAMATATEVSKAVDSLEPRGLLATFWDKTKAAFGSSKAQADLTLRPYSGMNARDNYFQGSPTVHFYTEQARNALRDEASLVTTLTPSASPDSVMNVAKANVAARTITTNQGPLIMPRGVNLQTVFGVAPGNQSQIGNAIDGILHSTVADSRFQLSFSQGRLFAQEFDKDGQRVGTGSYINADQIKARIAEDTAKEQKAAGERFGGGKVVQQDDKTLRYSGINSAGVQNDWMLGFRDNLVKNEGVRGQVYQDTVGKNTVGVGIAEGNPNYPQPDKEGKITNEQLTGSFAGATDDAAKAGIKIARRVHVENKAGFSLMSELAYHSGTNFVFQKNDTGEQYRTFLKAVNSGNLLDAQTALKGTAAYRVSGADRQKHYLDLLGQAMYNPRRATGVVTN